MDIGLRSLFKPMQANGRIPSYAYAEWAPAPLLKPYVACYWASEPLLPEVLPVEAVKAEVDRVLPDGCMDFIYEYDMVQQSCRMQYCGAFDRSFIIDYDPRRPVRKLGVRFFPGGAPSLLGLSAADFTNQHVSLELIRPNAAAALGEHMNLQTSASGRIAVLERFLLSRLQARGAGSDDLVKNVLHRIFSARGSVSVGQLAAAEAISTRQLNRKLNEWTGIGPKKFSEIVRFQAAIGAIRMKGAAGGSRLALDYGFFDQAHGIREFRRFYGATPEVAAAEYRHMSVLSNPRLFSCRYNEP